MDGRCSKNLALLERAYALLPYQGFKVVQDRDRDAKDQNQNPTQNLSFHHLFKVIFGNHLQKSCVAVFEFRLVAVIKVYSALNLIVVTRWLLNCSGRITSPAYV